MPKVNKQSTNRLNSAFVGIPTFLRAPICTDISQFDGAIAVMGIPFDEGSPFLPGTRKGPRALREHSMRFGSPAGIYEAETKKTYLEYELKNNLIVDIGDADILPTNVEKTFENITAMTREALDREALVVALGGDHSITYPVVRAFSGPLHVIQLDAHTDYSPFIHGLRFTNGHAFRHINKMPNVLGLNQVGIRGLRNPKQTITDSVADGNRIVTISEFRHLTPKGIADLVPSGAPCYVSIDVDVLDMSLVPGCVSAEPNGMSYGELQNTLKAIAEHTTVVGFDFVEVNPLLDVATGVTSYLGAHTVISFLGHICDQPYWLDRRKAVPEPGKRPLAKSLDR
jgi:agmatinase